MSKQNNGTANANNHSNQLNDNNAAYWSSRGVPAPEPSSAPPAPAPPTPDSSSGSTK